MKLKGTQLLAEKKKTKLYRHVFSHAGGKIRQRALVV